MIIFGLDDVSPSPLLAPTGASVVLEVDDEDEVDEVDPEGAVAPLDPSAPLSPEVLAAISPDVIMIELVVDGAV